MEYPFAIIIFVINKDRAFQLLKKGFIPLTIFVGLYIITYSAALYNRLSSQNWDSMTILAGVLVILLAFFIYIEASSGLVYLERLDLKSLLYEEGKRLNITKGWLVKTGVYAISLFIISYCINTLYSSPILGYARFGYDTFLGISLLMVGAVYAGIKNNLFIQSLLLYAFRKIKYGFIPAILITSIIAAVLSYVADYSEILFINSWALQIVLAYQSYKLGFESSTLSYMFYMIGLAVLASFGIA